MKINGYALLQAAAALCAALVLTGCSLLKVAVATGDPLSKEEMNVRTMTRGFYYDMAAEVARTADSIAQAAPDVATRVAAVRWKIHATRAGVSAAMQGIPDVALADMWILCRRMNERFAATPDSLLFGAQSGMARDAAARLDRRAARLARQVLAEEHYALMERFVAQFFNRKLSARGYSSGVWVKDNVKEQQNAGQATVRFVNVHNLIAGEHSRTGAWRVFEFDKDGSLIRVLHAPEANYISGRGWHLKDAKVETLPKITHDETPMVEKSSARKDVDLMLPSEMRPEILGVLTIKPERMGISDLWQYIAHLKETRQTSDRYQVALWSKVFYPLAIFVMLAVAMPFAYLNTRSGGVSIKIFAGLMIGISFYALNNIFSFLGVLNTWHPMVVAVVPTSVMLICAALWSEVRNQCTRHLLRRMHPQLPDNLRKSMAMYLPSECYQDSI